MYGVRVGTRKDHVDTINLCTYERKLPQLLNMCISNEAEGPHARPCVYVLIRRD